MEPVRLVILGVKGGIGKSTISALLAKELALTGRKVALLDRELLGTPSFIFGLEGKGLVSKIVDGEEPEDVTKFMRFGSGSVTLLKLLGDGERAFRDFKVIKEGPLREKLISFYKRFFYEGNFDYVIVDNPDEAYLDLDIVREELNMYYSIYPESLNIRIYVSELSRNVISSTVRYVMKLESEFDKGGYALAFVINMVPREDEALREAKAQIERVIYTTGIPIGVIIPFYRELKKDDVLESSIYEIRELSRYVQSKVKPEKTIISPRPKELLDVLRGNFAVLMYGPPDSGKISIALKQMKGIQGNVSVLLTNQKFKNKAQELNLDVTWISVLPNYLEDRFMAKNISDILRLAKRLSTDTLTRAKDAKLIIVYRTNDLLPSSVCCDVFQARSEFWRAFINSMKFKSNGSLLLICDDVHNECDEIVPYVDYLIKVKDESYEVRENL
ncbi:MAG: P-loop NTPase [Metallosphaera sp.]|uniref:nucleotide-binding protein n=1 Tax=Metallosphaera sp. TaxID=2020860 RepID=UPI00315EF123